MPTVDSGRQMLEVVGRLFPICRSITGEGVRQTLRAVGELIPLTIHEVPTGTKAFDWVVPKEWTIRDAYIKDAGGSRIVDFRASNLHVVNYSVPVRATMPLSDLQAHLHSLPERPEAIPYRTTYYNDDWGFCLAHRQREALDDGEYEVCIDSTLADGRLTYGECVLPGETDGDVLVYTHTCHPSLANDNLTGIVVCAFLAQQLAQAAARRYTYRFVFGPGTIGSLVWLSRNQERLAHIRHGLVAVLLGDSAALRYKQSRRGDAEIDRAARHVLARSAGSAIDPFVPDGYDERQFCSPGINLPVGRLSRAGHGGYAEYHTSADNVALIRPESLNDALTACAAIFEILEANGRYVNTSPFGEPQLGRRGLYRRTGGDPQPDRELAMLWLLNLSDGSHSLLDIAERSGIEFRNIRRVADELIGSGLLIHAE
jgi:aminopeptidase-like protein